MKNNFREHFNNVHLAYALFFNFSNRTYRTEENSVRSYQPFTFQHVDQSSYFTSYGKNNLTCN